MTVLVHGPGGYSKPPYGSFAGKPTTSGDSKFFVQNFLVMGPGGYSRPPEGSFAGKVAAIVVAAPTTVDTHDGFGPREHKFWKEQQDKARPRREEKPDVAEPAITATPIHAPLVIDAAKPEAAKPRIDYALVTQKLAAIADIAREAKRDADAIMAREEQDVLLLLENDEEQMLQALVVVARAIEDLE